MLAKLSLDTPPQPPGNTPTKRVLAAMASRASVSASLFFAVNLLFFSLTGASDCPTPPKPKPPPSPAVRKCPVNTLKLSACGNVLNGLINVGVGKFPKQPCECCSFLDGLVDVEAAVCLCTALRANVLGFQLNVPINLSLVLNYCGKKVPTEFQCP